MYRVLIVDDEPIHVRGLTNMLKLLRPDYHIADASDGQEAFEYMKCNQVDILFTDVKMPIMDGLQLIENIKKTNDEVKIIILSAYGYFEYAQKAIALGAFDYILKPVDGEKVEAVLNKAECKIAEERRDKSEHTKLRIQLDHALPEYHEHKLNKLIYGRINPDEFEEMNRLFPFGDTGAVIVFDLDRYDVLSGDPFNAETKLRIEKMIYDALSLLGKAITFFLQDETHSIVSILKMSGDRLPLGEKSAEILNGLVGTIKESFGLDISIGVGTVYKNPLHEAKTSFKYAKRALEYGFYTGYGQAIHYNDLHIIDHEQWIPKKETELTNAVLNLDKALSIEIIENIFSSLSKDGYPKPDQLIHRISDLLKNQTKAAANVVKMNMSSNLETDININLFRCRSLEELKSLTHKIMDAIIDGLAAIKSCKNKKTVDACKKYIDEHYMEELSLEAVAKLFYFNPAYFSNMFKTNTNVNFSQYVNEIRLRKAKALLRDTNHKVYEISQMVGYRDAKYFIKLFKKECGLTPDEYRSFLERE